MNKENCIIYVRVSSKKQVDEGTSLEKQQIDCSGYASRNNLNILETFIEKGESAKTDDRTKLKEMLLFCANKKQNIKYLVIYKSDRLARNTQDYLKIKSFLFLKGIKIKSITENFDETPAGKLQEIIMAGFSEYDNDIRTERVVNGSKQAVLQGRCPGQRIFGYIADKDMFNKATIKPDPKYQKILQEMFETICKNIYPLDEVRKIYFKKGIANPKTGKIFSKGYFMNYIQKEILCGRINKFGIKTKGKFESVVDEATFDKAQRVIKGKLKPISDYKYNNPDFPLRRFVFDENENTMTGSWSQGRNKKYAFYRFGSKGKNYSRDLIENTWIKFMNSYRLDERLISKLEKAIVKVLASKNKITAITINDLKLDIDRLNNRETEVIDLKIRGTMNEESLAIQLGKINEERAQKQAIFDALSEKLVSTEACLEHTKKYLSNPSDFWLNADLKTKQALQWFQFPDGIAFDGKNFGTTKIASIFIAKKSFSPYSKSIVGDSVLFWNQIQKEIVYLNTILNPNSN
jgi:site-specific DNA recombinase